MTIAALLVHGFGGDRAVWDRLAPHLEAHGVPTHRLALAGHEDDAAELATTPWHVWLDQMRAGVDDLRNHADHVSLVGYSMGSTIGLHALAEHLVDSAVLICPSVTVPPAQRIAVATLSALRVRGRFPAASSAPATPMSRVARCRCPRCARISTSRPVRASSPCTTPRRR